MEERLSSGDLLRPTWANDLHDSSYVIDHAALTSPWSMGYGPANAAAADTPLTIDTSAVEISQSVELLLPLTFGPFEEYIANDAPTLESGSQAPSNETATAPGAVVEVATSSGVAGTAASDEPTQESGLQGASNEATTAAGIAAGVATGAQTKRKRPSRNAGLEKDGRYPGRKRNRDNDKQRKSRSRITIASVQASTSTDVS